MIEEQSCGSVVYKVIEGQYQFLLIKQKNSKHYGFPKGHVEADETKEETAKREVYEETGIQINLFSHVQTYVHYEPKKGVNKRVDYFLSEAINSDFTIQESEVEEILWVDKKDVIGLLTYENDQEVFLELTKNLERNNKKTLLSFGVLTLIILSFVTLTDYFNWGYWYKASFKLILFIFIPYLYLKIYKLDFSSLFKVNKKEIYRFILYGIFIYVITLLGYFIVRNWIDFQNIPETLEKTLGITRENFIYVAIYIPVVNALIEEFFFRGFILKYFQRYFKSQTVILITATLFALYHVAIIAGWSSPLVIVLAIIGLFIVGILFGYIAHKKKSIIPTYILHFAANLAINTAALIILGIV